MDQEIKLLIQAIENLRQESSFLKDYIFHLASGLFSSLLGGGVAYFALRYHENIQIEKNKMDVANKWLILAENAFSSLIAIKTNYHGKLNVNPMQRASIIPSFILGADKIHADLTALSFVVPKEEDISSYQVRWRNIPRIRGMINNYNIILDMWEKRNEIDRPIKEKILSDYSSKGYVGVTVDQIFKSVGSANFISLIDLTEKSIKLTDDLIVELYDFLSSFPKITKSLIKTNKIKNYGTVLTFSTNENQKLLDLINKSPEVSYQLLSNLYGQPAEQIKNAYTTGYEDEERL